MSMVHANALRKEYGDFIAVEGSTFDVEKGEVFGIVGPNGAGKTTTLKMLAGLIEPTSGSGTIAGYDTSNEEMRRELGFLPEESPLYEEMTPRSYLRFFANLYDVPADVADRRIEATLTELDLDHRDRRLGNMSKGMKRKVAIARSLVNDPSVLIYDEPASGLDPLTTNNIIEFTKDLAAQGKTIIFSAHNLHHVEEVSDRVAIMNEGRIVAKGALEDIRQQYGATQYYVYTDIELPGVEQDAVDGQYRATVASMDAVEDLQDQVEAAGGDVVDIQTRNPTLEDIFLDLAEQAPEDSPRDTTMHDYDEDGESDSETLAEILSN